MKPTFKFLIGLACAFATEAHVQAQGTIVPNGITYSSAGLTAVIDVLQNPTSSDYTRFGLRPRFTTPPQHHVTIFSFDLPPGESVRAFLVSSNDPISLQPIQAGSYLELSSGGFYGFDLDVPFYLGFYTGITNAMPSGTYGSPVFGWGEFVNSAGVIHMLDAALVAGGDGIYAGTQSIISIPEPRVLSLVPLSAFLFGLYGKRSKGAPAHRRPAAQPDGSGEFARPAERDCSRRWPSVNSCIGQRCVIRLTLTVFVSALLVSACSQKRTATIDESINVVPGKNIVVRNYVLSVKKRDGSSLEGIRIAHREPDGRETIITADTGTMTESPKQRVELTSAGAKARDKLSVAVIRNSVKMTLFNANVQTTTQSGTTHAIVQQMELSF